MTYFGIKESDAFSLFPLLKIIWLFGIFCGSIKT